MTIFNVLFFLNLLLIALAVVRLRPTALMIAVNQAVTLRALDGIQSFGQPASEPFLPSGVFTQESLDVAWKVFAIATLLLGISLLRQPREAPAAQPRYPALPRLAIYLLTLYLVLLTISSRTLWNQGYTNEGGDIFGVSLGGLNALMLSLLMYEVTRRVLIGQWRPLMGLLVLGGVLFLTSYSKGSTGLATGYGACAAVMLWPAAHRSTVTRALTSLAILAAFGVTAFVVRGARNQFHREGWSAVTEVVQNGNEREANRGRQQEGLEVSANGTQYACHVLECVHLYESGIARSWKSIYNPLVFTFEPSFLLEPLGLARPLDAPWELATYYEHGGGIYTLGELYWNGGYFCVIVVFGAILLLAYYCDTRFRRSAFWLMLCVQFAPNIFMGFGYGFAQVSRGAINGLLVMAVYATLPTFRLRSKRNTVDAISPRRVDVRQARERPAVS